MVGLRRILGASVASAIFVNVLGAPATAHAAAATRPPAPVAHIQPSGDGGWRPSARPANSTFAWKPPSGRGVPLAKTDPHAKRLSELTNRRTANASFFRMSDGSVQEQVSAVPVHYRDAHGIWQNIDTAVKPVANGGFSAGAEGNSFHTYFSGAAGSLVRLVQGGSSVEVGVDGASTGSPKVSGSGVTYAGALGGADLTYQVTPDGVKESVVLRKAPAAGASYGFTLKVAPGLRPKQLADGAIELDAVESGQAVFVIPAPYMSDSKADANSPYGKAYSAKVSQSMTWDAKSDTLRLTVTPDSGWLHDAKRQYPVTVDPTIVVAPTPSQAQNVMILADGATTNYSTSWRLSVGTTTTGAARSLIKFPMPSVPAGTQITSADLRLYYDQTFTTGSNNVALQALAANAAWNPATATWSNSSSITGPVAGTTTAAANAAGVWNDFPVTSTVQGWLNGTATNNGFVLKAANEATLGQGGPRYEGSLYAYGGEVVNYPQLVIRYGVQGVAVNPPSVIHANGAELSWPAYTNTTGNSGNDLAEYQVHRSVFQTFTPGASTEVAPVGSSATSFVDSTAQPTPANNSDPYGNAYYYMVAVKTKNGQLISGPTQLVRLPEAGRTTVILRSVAATTLSSSQPNAVLNTLSNGSAAEPWLEVGDNSGTYGTARSVFDFGALPADIAANATILDAHLKLWQETTTTGTSGAVYELHGLNTSFTGTQATWNHATTATAWTTAGGDMGAVAGTVSGFTNDPNRRNLDATSVVQGWAAVPSSNHGLEVKLAAESSTSPQERTIFAGPNTGEPQLAPELVVTYLDATTDDTYFAPDTPAAMNVGTTYTVPVTVNNTTTTTWTAANVVLTYHWQLPDGTDVTSSANQLQTALPNDMAPGATATINASVTPPTPADTNELGGYNIAWDMYNKTTGTYLSSGSVGGAAPLTTAHAARSSLAMAAGGTGGIGSLKQATGVQAGSNQLGLNKFYQYDTTATGDGSALYTNVSSGNTVWNENLFSNPSRGFATFLRLNYNSLDTTDTTTGFGWSLQASTPTRLGQALGFHPKTKPTQVTLTDGTGSSHLFTTDSSGNWVSPPGVHLYLQQLDSCGPQTVDARAWSMTRPDRTVFYYDCEGYPTAVVDKDGNEADFTYTGRQSENKPEEFLTYITDPASRQTLTLTYYNKGDNYNYIDSTTGQLVAGTGLTNPFIIDTVKSITDISGRTVTFIYTDKGLLARVIDGDGTSLAKTFNFTYDATQGNKNVKLVAVQDPRGNTTNLAYYQPPNDPAHHWWTQSIADRLGHATNFAYTQPGTITGSAIQTTVTNAKNNSDVYQLDSTGRMIQAVNALGQKTTLTWDGDNNVNSLTEDNGAQTQWTYDPNTGYPLTHKDALAVKNNTAAETYSYQTSLNGHIADVTDKVSAAGRHWHFGYDAKGNLLTVQDPMGTSTGSGYTTTYGYDGFGELLTVTDPLNHTTTYSNYDPSGYPGATKDALGNTATVVYGPRGEVTSATDALGHTTTQNYDVFGRLLDGKTPKDQASGVYITSPAPVYDRNDNSTQTTAANGAVSTAVYDAMDQLTSETVPQDTTTSPARTTTYTYDAVGNLLTTTEPNGNVSGAPAGSYTTTTTYDALNRPIAVVDGANDKTTTGYDDVGNAVNTTDPVKNAIAGNTTYTAQTAYDLDHRPTAMTDAAGKTGSIGYDLDGNKVSSTDRNGNTTIYTLDPRALITQIQVPHTGTNGTISYDTSQYVYDQAGNETQAISPRGVASGIANAYAEKYSYDADNRLSAQFGAYNPNDGLYNTAPETDYGYDAAGRLTKVTAPASGGQTVRPVTTTSYFDNGWTKSSTDPFGISTSYDYNSLGKQTSRTITSAGGSSSSTQSWGYYPDGKLQTASDSGVPVGLQVQMVDNSDVQNASPAGTWTSSNTGTGYQGYDYETHAAGAGTDSFTWNLTVPQDGNYTVYVQYPQVTGAATSAGYTINYSGGSATATVDQTQNTGTWVSLGKFAFTQNGTNQKVTLAQNAGGAVTADAVKIVRDNSGDTQPNPQSFVYTYDPNGNLTDLADKSPNALYDDYAYTYDGVNRITQLQEKLAGAVKHGTGFGYDADGHETSQTHDATSATFTYDVRNLLATVVNKETSSDAGKTTTYTYTPTAQIATETKGNGNVVTSTYNLDDSLTGTVEKTSSGTLVASHAFTYDPNLNQTQDASVTQNADNHAATLNRTATDTYTPADQVASVTNSDGAKNQSYTYDQAGNITAQSVGGVSTTNVYDRNRLLRSSQNGVTGNYNYDVFGRTDTVTVGGVVEQRYSYDGYDRITSAQQYNGAGLTTTNYAFDAFGRTVTETENAGTSNAKTTSFDYLATASAVVGERVNGTLTKSYQYSPWGERLTQIVHNSDGTEDPTYYSYDQHTNVQAITDSSGNAKSTYGYTAYGSNDSSQATGVDKNSSTGGATTTDPYNSYRFNADRIDSNTGNYDMGFRTYDAGLNRFLSRDMYNGAFADTAMSTDPYTGNRYTFGGGNPISNIELDGHDWVTDHGGTDGPRFSVGSNGEITDNVVATMESLRDAVMFSLRLKATYVGAYDPVSKRYAVGVSWGSRGFCAERDACGAGKLGVPMDQPFFSSATQYISANKQRTLDVCPFCQADTYEGQYAPGVKGQSARGIGSRWTAGGEIHTGPTSNELAIPDKTSKALVPIRRAATDTAVGGSEVSTASRVLRGASTTLKWAGRGLMVLGIAADVYDVATAPAGQQVQTAVKDSLSLAGAWAGAEVGAEGGAAIGALVGGPVGAAVGGIVGGIGGAIIGGGLGDAIGNEISSWF